MCGLVGFFGLSAIDNCHSLIGQMVKKLMHRGPDAQGVWCDEAKMTAFAHSRLSIHDVSTGGAQPMRSHSGRWVIVFNGEIYNFRSIKESLAGAGYGPFKGDSDTEVLANAIDAWGVEVALKRFVGMFAIAAYDTKLKKIFLARDRLGEKPLYYSLQKGILGFSSELKALKPLTQLGWSFIIDRQALSLYMEYGYVPQPHSIYQQIFKLKQGCYLEFDSRGQVDVRPYWDAAHALSQDSFAGTYADAVDTLEEKLKESVRLQMDSDVPLGAFLSGGVDSSVVVALMQSMSANKINTFSIGYHETQYNEAEYASAVAKHIGTNHTNLYVTDADALEVIPKLPVIYDEPLSDSSQIPTFLVSQLARKKVTVALSGDGGDELFGGYQRYPSTYKVKRKFIDNVFIAAIARKIPLRLVEKALKGRGHIVTRIEKLKTLLSQYSSPEASMHLFKEVMTRSQGRGLVLGAHAEDIITTQFLPQFEQLSYMEWMMYVDSQTYMIDDVLAKVDRAAMAVSLETRVPLLDHRIYEFAWQLPLQYKMRGGVGKSVLRDVLYRYVPKHLIDRPKMGFAVPVSHWLKGELRDWAEELLDPQRIMKQGYLDSRRVSSLWKSYLSGEPYLHSSIWTVLMFQAWLEEQ